MISAQFPCLFQTERGNIDGNDCAVIIFLQQDISQTDGTGTENSDRAGIGGYFKRSVISNHQK